MRTSSTFVILAGIAACDFYNMGAIVYDSVIVVLQKNGCWNLYNYNFQLFRTWKMALSNILRRENSYLGILMALVRYSVIKYSMDAKFEYISKPIFGIIVFMVTFFCSSLVSGFYFSHFYLEMSEWSPPEQCPGYPVNYTEMYYIPMVPLEFFSSTWFGFQTYMFVDGLIKIVPTILLPILTLLLIAEIRAAKRMGMKISSNMKKSQSEHTTKLVTVMTVASMVAEGPMGLAYVLQGSAEKSMGIIWFKGRS
ncbi:hypothetical protein CRE_12999 [Caenorhabditis remanei]|uniref:G-protein coupled receptors family 1 profile domain-containing protein n=1 Tax=Caenorhabditis remanei TaxID=31234 RepID=E3N166_CAERE|nr:hypothetical protein CRE_12999 [Caenorhabditis remanei]